MRLTKSAALAVAAIVVLAPLAAKAQTSPNLTKGQVLTAGQWNNLFAGKQDTLGYTPMNAAGGTFSGRVVTSAPGATLSGLNLTPGTAPGAPVNGDVWVTSAGMFVRVNGSTIGPLASSASVSVTVGSTPILGGTTTRVLFDDAGQLGEYSISGTGNVAMTTSPVFTTPSLGASVGTSLALNGCSLSGNALCATGSMTISGALNSGAFSISSNSANSLVAGPNGSTNPVLKVDSSTASQAAGLSLTGAVTGGTVALAAIDSGSNTNLSINAKGTGTIQLGNTSTGNISLGRSTSVTGTITGTSSSASALAVGLNGATNPVLQVDASTGSQATGLKITGASTSGGVAIAAIDSGLNTPLLIDAKGSGTITLGGTSVGNIILSRAVQASAGMTVSSSFTATGLVTYPALASSALATASNYYAAAANTLVPTSVIYPSEVTVTYGTTTSFDFDTFINAAVTLTGNITTNNVSNARAGKSGAITYIQDGVGGRTAVFNSIFKFAGGIVPTLSTAGGAIDVLFYSCRSATVCPASLSKDVK